MFVEKPNHEDKNTLSKYSHFNNLFSHIYKN